MSNLREIQRRISSVKATSQITRTMEMVSTAKIRKALERAEEAEPYKDAISRMMGAVVGASLDERQPLLAKHAEEKNVLFIVVASDRGLAGGFNVQPQRDVQRKMDALKAKGVGEPAHHERSQAHGLLHVPWRRACHLVHPEPLRSPRWTRQTRSPPT